MTIRLITYGTRNFALRRFILNISARLSGAVKKIEAYGPDDLKSIGFSTRCSEINLRERGSGWWAWKPFLICHELETMKDGDWLLYCDIGRNYPFKIIDGSLQCLIDWTEERNQACMPGVLIPWNGPMSRWTKRDAFVLTEMDRPDCHSGSPIQASFSLWKAGDEAKRHANQWLDWCSDRSLITDDDNTCGKENLPGYQEHRHDQSLLTLLCLKEGIMGLSIGDLKPDFDEKNPAYVSKIMGETHTSERLLISLIKRVAPVVEVIEIISRKLLPKKS